VPTFNVFCSNDRVIFFRNEKTVAFLQRQRFEFGGLGRNRTTDTRIFNAPLQTANRATASTRSVLKVGCACLCCVLQNAAVKVFRTIFTIPLIRVAYIFLDTTFLP
jgi:hypothetical protein